MENQVVPPEGDKNAGPKLEAVYGLWLFIAFILVNLRLYVRARILKKLWWDDFFLLLGVLLSITTFGTIIARVNSGFGRHAYYLSPKQISFTLELQQIGALTYFLSCMFTKVSICLFLLRIFVTNRVWRRIMYMIMALIVATQVSSTILVLPQCIPVAKLWHPTIKGTCWPRETITGIYYYQGGLAIFTDFLLAFLPTYFLKDIQISFRTKLSICALMSLGVFTGICAINRTVLLISSIVSSDVTYSSINLTIWAGLETNVAIIAATIPALRPLWAKPVNPNQRNREQASRPDKIQRMNSAYAIMDQRIETDSLPSRLETRITAEGGRDHGSRAKSLSDCTGIMKTSDVSLKNFRKFEGKWIQEHSSLSDKERSVEEMV